MRNPQGYGVTVDPDGKITEEDSFTCFHCNAVVFVKAGADPSSFGGFCRMCMRHVCGRCADAGGCDPFEKQMERMEARDRFRRSVG